jgi:hypothetical protein
MDFYTSRLHDFSAQLLQLKKKHNTVSIFRFLLAIVFLVLGYYSLQPGDAAVLYILMFICVILFFFLMKTHGNISKNKTRAEAIVAINNDEISYLSGESTPFGNGAEYIDFKHPYSYDLDIFGDHSLFQNINRTQTYKGSETLGALLLKTLPQEDILRNQEAIQELAAMPEWRQEIMALGRTGNDSRASYSRLIGWSRAKAAEIPRVTNLISFISPIAIMGLIIAYFATDNASLLSYAGYLFSFNIMFFFSRTKMISLETGGTTEVHSIIERYSVIIKQIEKQSFTSEKLNSLKSKLVYKDQSASKHISHLADLFSRMDTIANIFAAVVFNGLFLLHIHTLRSLLKWKEEHAQNIVSWLEVIGEVEALGSLANLYYNNPDFTFPVLNNDHRINFNNLAHPLLNRQSRVGNDVSFTPDFMILTGSNMSGKSTFLRSLGINMVLAGIGAPVCAASADVHPLPVLVSMRLSDSLSDSESYFFAEIKRLKLIMDALQGQRAFVLLDEILRGTNSDDKRTGTIEVVKKMIGLRAIGAIATHDIEVCNTTYEYPESLTNQCFEVQIVDNELYFDYKLREGICKNKSATFLMEKWGVI